MYRLCYIYIYQTLLSKATYSAIHLYCQYVWSLGIKPTTFALLTQCSNHWATGTQVVLQSWNVSNMHLDSNGATAEKLPFGQITFKKKKKKKSKTQHWKQCSLSKGALLNIELPDFNLPFMLNGAENAVRHYNVKDVKCVKLRLYSSSISSKSISSNFFPNKAKTEWTIPSPNNSHSWKIQRFWTNKMIE